MNYLFFSLESVWPTFVTDQYFLKEQLHIMATQKIVDKAKRTFFPVFVLASFTRHLSVWYVSYVTAGPIYTRMSPHIWQFMYDGDQPGFHLKGDSLILACDWITMLMNHGCFWKVHGYVQNVP